MAAATVTPIPAPANETAYLKQDWLKGNVHRMKKDSQPFGPRFFLISTSPGLRQGRIDRCIIVGTGLDDEPEVGGWGV